MAFAICKAYSYNIIDRQSNRILSSYNSKFFFTCAWTFDRQYTCSFGLYATAKGCLPHSPEFWFFKKALRPPFEQNVRHLRFALSEFRFQFVFREHLNKIYQKIQKSTREFPFTTFFWLRHFFIAFVSILNSAIWNCRIGK